MVDYNTYQFIADRVYKSIIKIDDDAYLTWDDAAAEDFKQQVNHIDREYIGSLVDIAMEQYDLSDMTESDINAMREDAIDEVYNLCEEHLNKYTEYKHNVTMEAYRGICQAIEEVPNVASVDVDHQPADPEVGIYHDETCINVKLVNGSVISLDVSFDEGSVL